MTAPITTMQIYWGAVPFVIIQIIMIGLVIAFLGYVQRYIQAKRNPAGETIRPARSYFTRASRRDDQAGLRAAWWR